MLVSPNAASRLHSPPASPASPASRLLIGAGNEILDTVVLREKDGLTRADLLASFPGGVEVLGEVSKQGSGGGEVRCVIDEGDDAKGFKMFRGREEVEWEEMKDGLSKWKAVRVVINRKADFQTLPYVLQKLHEDVEASESLFAPNESRVIHNQEEWMKCQKTWFGKKETYGTKRIEFLETYLMRNKRPTNFEAPVVSFIRRGTSTIPHRIRLDAVVLVNEESKFKDTLVELRRKLSAQILAAEKHLKTSQDSTHVSFYPISLALPLTMSLPISFNEVGDAESKTLSLRRKFHIAYQLPMDRPILRLSNAVAFRENDKSTSSKLLNVHENLRLSGVEGGKPYLVDGDYLYSHYMQDGFNDDGWGCAYRTFQTICSWLKLQGYTTLPIPSHREIQTALVACDENQNKSLIGSRQWIGAVELQNVMQYRYGIPARILFVQSGADVGSKSRELAKHFETQGTPVMIGGGYLAYGLLGIDWNEDTGECKYLILDPHYKGSEDIKKIIKGGWCGWKDASLFKSENFYNFCLPQRPREI